MVQSTDPFWHHVEEMKCIYCGRQFPNDTSISRIKWHLSGEKGRGVAICERVPKQVQEAAFLAMHGVKKRHKSIASSSNVNDNAISTTPQERQNNEDDNFGTVLEEITNVREDDIENGTGGVVQPGAGASSSGGLTGNTNETPGDPLPTRSTKLVGRAFEQNSTHIFFNNHVVQFVGFLIDQEKSGWTLLMTNLILECASAVCDQLGYALIGMVLAYVALLLATAELVYKERMDLLPRFRRPSTSPSAPGKPVGTIVEYFGLVSAVWQCFYSTMEYAYARQKKDNPIKMSLLPFLFLLCVVFSKL